MLTSVGNTGARDAGVTVHPIMQSWSWREAPRFARFVKRCAPDAVLLMYLGGMYKYHPMITFAPTLVKRQLPRPVRYPLREPVRWRCAHGNRALGAR